ncbi:MULTISPECIES: DUF3426 domain-containing protein [unclassified Acinetobacter]|uniref:DUF3426 domain-containing protein n=1 Tax=unclassified Acinetobacter TaxID=196816 RepID=UPI00190D18B6|nr:MULTISPECIES: DUF3426 domain-containing protein [unclassified Acinetobacter]MBK0062962.1 DUF3426 domain-containing protein [Acinetobacter sp. S55]MBK0066620.1 DUF3426 domain-containing protein [Acinetobacter sp. S54]
MSEKQTRCPKCLTIYKVSLTQLTVAQGMVCCPKCNLSFNALTNLVSTEEHSPSSIQHSSLQQSAVSASSFQYSSYNILDIFNRRIENSNIDLLTYLNNLNYFQNEEIGSFPQLNLAEGDLALDTHPNQSKKRSLQYYVMWSFINLILLGILLFQIVWFNPRIMHNSPVLGAMFNQLCSVFSCKKLEEKYTLLTINKVKVVAVEHHKTRFSGVLVNYHDKSLPLPLLKLTLKDKHENSSIILKPQDYLSESLSGIQRIPKNLPYKFEFTINQSRKSFNDYTLEIVHP